MKISVIGGTGFIGSKIVEEAARRGHDVIAISRSVDQDDLPDGATAVPTDVFETDALADVIKDTEAVIHSFTTPKSLGVDERVQLQKKGTASIIEAVKKAGIKRLLAVGGAGTLEIAPGVRFMDSYIFPKIWEGGAQSTAPIKEMLSEETDFEWTSLSPPHHIVPGERTGRYRVGLDKMVCDETGQSKISVDDYAVAMIDELESSQHSGRRFTAAY